MKLQIWDTAGTEKHRSITESYYKCASGVILTYGVDDRKSFDSIIYWAGEVREKNSLDIPLILVGNKSDLTEKKRKVTEDQG